MSTALHVTALMIAVLSVPTLGGLTAWALAGGDGTSRNRLLGVLGLLVGIGCVYNAVTCWTAFSGLPDWRWWAMLVAPAAGLLGLVAYRDGQSRLLSRDGAVGLAMQAGLAVPAALLLAGGVVEL